VRARKLSENRRPRFHKRGYSSQTERGILAKKAADFKGIILCPAGGAHLSVEPKSGDSIPKEISAKFHGEPERGRLARVFPGLAHAGEPPALLLQRFPLGLSRQTTAQN